MTNHCAKFSDALLPVALEMLDPYFPDRSGGVGLSNRRANMLDPFAGTGKGCWWMTSRGFSAVGIELEPEWANQCGGLVDVGDALDLPYKARSFDIIFTSPAYGNRMADKDMRESVAGTYAKSLGRIASDGSSCHMQWGSAYREFHIAAWEEAKRVLVDGGFFLLNIKDHPRNKVMQGVPEWHFGVLGGLGFQELERRFITTPGNRRGANKDTAVDGEYLWLGQLR